MNAPTELASLDAGPASDSMREGLRSVMSELARMAIDGGVRFGALEELMKEAMVAAATRAIAESGSLDDPSVSRLSAMTGIHRKEVKRLAGDGDPSPRRAERSPASEVFTRWCTHPDWQAPDGTPLVLPRRSDRADVRCFDKLTREVTSDVYPKTLLDELLRLGLVTLDPLSDRVSLARTAFVPSGDIAQVVEISSANVADHVAAVRTNLAAITRNETPPFVEQAVFADGLGPSSTRVACDIAVGEWNRLMASLVPRLQALEDGDRATGTPPTHRFRVGLFCFAEPLATDAPRGMARPGSLDS